MARKMSGRLVALSTAAITTIFTVGYIHTQPAAAQLASADALATMSSSRSIAENLPSTANVPARPQVTITQTTETVVANSAFYPAPVFRSQRDGDQGGGGEDGERQRLGESARGFAVPTATPGVVAAGATTAAQTRYRDGSYSGMGENRHGDVQVTVVIAGGRIASAAIADCGMQYPCSRIAMLPGQVVTRQSVNVDLVSGATMSSTAYQDAVVQALSKAAI